MAKGGVVILGGKGMLGSDLTPACREQGWDVTCLDLPDFDITNEHHLQNALEDTGVVVNCAAYTNVEKAESEAELAYKVNAEAVGKLGLLARKAAAYVVHISTDFVFDGTLDRPYLETDTPNPINAYGKSKLAGEELLIESQCNYCIMRIEWTYGLAGSNFVTKLISAAKQGKELKVVDDQAGSPTATIEVAKVICDLLKQRPQGLFHFASEGFVSRFEMAKFIFDKLNIAVNLKSCKTADFPSAAARPLNSRFNCGKIKTLLGAPIKPWQSPLENFVRQL